MPKYRNSCKPIVWALFLSLLTLIVYLPALQNGFVNWDDQVYVYENTNIQTLDYRLFTWGITARVMNLWHPLSFFSLALDYAVWGLDPAGYHLTNILLHALNTVLVYFLAVRLIGCNSSKQTLIAASLTSILFSIHPLHVESVVWISERKDVLCTFFFLLGLLAYLRYISSGLMRFNYIVSLLFFILASMSKPMAISLPMVFLILDYYPLRRFRSREDAGRAIIEKLPFFLAGAVVVLMTLWPQYSDSVKAEVTHPLVERLAVFAHGCVFYLQKMIIPTRLAPLYPYPLSVSLADFRYIGSAAILFLLFSFCIICLRRWKVIFCVFLYYIVTLIPVMGVIGKATPHSMADRYTYIPSLGPFLLIGLSIGYIYNRYPKRRLSIIAAVLFFIGVMTGMTVRQIRSWHDSITLWSHESRLFPYVSVAHHGMGEAYAVSGNYQPALRELNKAIELDIGNCEAYNIRGAVHSMLGNYQKAIMDFNMALEIRKKYKKAYSNRGVAYNALKEYDKALKDFDMVIELDPRSEIAYFDRGNAYYGLGDYEKAIRDYSKALEIDPLYVDAYSNRGYVYYLSGNVQQSINDLNKAIELDPQHADAYYNLGLAYLQSGNRDLTLFNYRKAAGLGSKEAQDYLNESGLN